jgi:hypothetical protein
MGPREPIDTMRADVTAFVVYGAALLVPQVKKSGPRGNTGTRINQLVFNSIQPFSPPMVKKKIPA